MERQRLPDWLRKSLTEGHEAQKTDTLIKDLGLHTICESGRCPNRNECYSQKTATFMIMGDVCTRSCRFCSVSTGRPEVLDQEEPARVAQAVRELGLEHVVVTSVDRDDLADEGTDHFVAVIRELKKISSELIIEILTPDFRRNQKSAVNKITKESPHIFNHNVETVPRLYREVCPQSNYKTSLQIFKEVDACDPAIFTKSGIMLGLGETPQEVLQVLRDLKEAGCDILTIGQYLQSSKLGLAVKEYVPPEMFLYYKSEAQAIGFSWVESGPFVRSSFHAKESFESLKTAIQARKSSSNVLNLRN